jgi:hypothetical protein
MKDTVNKSFKDAANRYWRASVTSKRARKQFKERLKANLWNLSLYCQPPKPCPEGNDRSPRSNETVDVVA